MKAKIEEEMIDEIVDWYRYLDAANSVIQKDISDVISLLYHRQIFEEKIEKAKKLLGESFPDLDSKVVQDEMYKNFGTKAEEIKKIVVSSFENAQKMMPKDLGLLKFISEANKKYFEELLNENDCDAQKVNNWHRFLNNTNTLLQQKIGDIFRSLYYRNSMEVATNNAIKRSGKNIFRETTDVVVDERYTFLGETGEAIKKFLEIEWRKAQRLFEKSLESLKADLGFTYFILLMRQFQPNYLRNFLTGAKSKKYEDFENNQQIIEYALLALHLQNGGN